MATNKKNTSNLRLVDSKQTPRKPAPLSRWAKHAIERIDEEFPSKRDKRNPLVGILKILVLAQDCGIDVRAPSKPA